MVFRIYRVGRLEIRTTQELGEGTKNTPGAGGPRDVAGIFI